MAIKWKPNFKRAKGKKAYEKQWNLESKQRELHSLSKLLVGNKDDARNISQTLELEIYSQSN